MKSGYEARGGTARVVLAAVSPMVAGVVLVLYAGRHLACAAGWAGTTGGLRVEGCARERVGGHRYAHCGGVFSSSDGSVVDPSATMDTRVSPHGTVAVRRTATGAYEQIGLAPSSGRLAITIFGLLVLLLGALVVYGGTGHRRVPRPLLVLLGSLGAAMLLSALAGGVAGVTGAL